MYRKYKNSFFALVGHSAPKRYERSSGVRGIIGEMMKQMGGASCRVGSLHRVCVNNPSTFATRCLWAGVDLRTVAVADYLEEAELTKKPKTLAAYTTAL